MPNDGPSDHVVRAWARLNLAQQRSFEAIEAELKARALPPLAWYDVLLELSRRPDHALPQAALQDALLFAQYNLSRLLDRLEKAGAVRREPDPDDGRAKRVVATEAGLALRACMWPAYATAIERHVGRHLTEAEAETLGALLGKLIRLPAGLRGGGGGL